MRTARSTSLLAALLVSCSGSSVEVDVRVLLPADASEIEAVEIRILEGGCDAGGGAIVYRDQLGWGETPAAAMELPAGRYGVYAEARRADCTIVARACIERELPADGDAVSVQLLPVAPAMPQACPGFCDGSGLCNEIGAPCPGHLGDCDGDPDNGCETSLDSLDHCGACGAACVPDNATGGCDLGNCVLTCAPDFADCDGSGANGCETDLRGPDVCGSCRNVCNFANGISACGGVDADVCELVGCVEGFDDCNADAADGCETDLTTPSSCGSCGSGCVTGPDVAEVTCTTEGSCAVATCVDGFADCNGIASDGCEIDLNADETHCGACDIRCSVGTEACIGGECILLMCPSGRFDCDGDPSNDCETDIRTDPAHCGGCGRACAAGPCSGGLCPEDVASVTAGATHNCAVRRDGDVLCWGDNSDGQLGHSTGTATVPTPMISLPAGWAAAPSAPVSAGTGVTCARRGMILGCFPGDATVFAPTPIASHDVGGGDVCSVGGSSGALELRCYDPATGSLVSTGLPPSLDYEPPVQVAMGDAHGCVRSETSFLGPLIRCWGDNDRGQLGVVDVAMTTNQLLEQATEITSGDDHTCILQSDPAINVRCWGDNRYGQLGRGTIDTVPHAPASMLLGAGPLPAEVSAGGRHTCIRLTTGLVRCVGDNASGQLGDGTTTTTADPVEVTGLTAVHRIAAGGSHTCAVVNEPGGGRGVWCWGSNSDGQLGMAAGGASSVPVRIPVL